MEVVPTTSIVPLPAPATSSAPNRFPNDAPTPSPYTVCVRLRMSAVLPLVTISSVFVGTEAPTNGVTSHAASAA